MTRDTLTGSRIRERRVMLGMRQAELARRAEVSASYLNLIEHNKRRIGGTLLLRIAQVLEVETTALTEGAEVALLASLREGASQYPAQGAELDRIEEFAGRFSGWARVLAAMLERQASLEQTVASLTDRMTHDPQLAEALHDVLDAVTAIRSTSSILVDTREIEPEWRDRFYRNINEEARRLAEGGEALVAYLDQSDMAGDTVSTTPQDEIEAFLRQHEYHFPDIDGDAAPNRVDTLIEASAATLVSASSREQMRHILHRAADDARALPQPELLAALETCALDPGLIAQRCAVGAGLVMRRLAALKGDHLAPFLPAGAQEGVGLAICDSSGTLTFRKPLSGFGLPRFGAACPLWTLYQALSRPMTPLRETVQQAGRDASVFDTYAIAEPVGALNFGDVPLMQAHMLIVPRAMPRTEVAMRPIGASCRICPRDNCSARREPSILVQGF